MDLDSGRSAEGALDPAVHDELGADQTCGHDHSGTETSEETLRTSLLGEDHETVDHGAFGAVTLVDLRQQSVSGLGLASPSGAV